MAASNSQAHIERCWTNGPNSAKTDENSIKIVSYNILASVHIKPRFYPYCPKGYRTVMERHPQLMVELRHHSDADIMCLQEVETEYFHQTLSHEMKDLGYDGIFHQKALGIREGVATFFKKNGFSLEKQKVAFFKDLISEALKAESLDNNIAEVIRQRAETDSPLLMTRFLDQKTGRHVTVTNLHLFWLTPTHLDLITLQACIAVQQMREFSGPDTASIVCGDFNHMPDLAAYQLVRDGYLSNESKQNLREFILPVNGEKGTSCLVDLLPNWFQHSCTDMKSAYTAVQGEEPPFTYYGEDEGEAWIEAYKSDKKLAGYIDKEESEEAADTPREFPLSVMDHALNITLSPPIDVVTLDYIWFSSKKLQCVGVEEVVKEELIKPFWGCPNEVFPSDHLLMKAAFLFI